MNTFDPKEELNLILSAKMAQMYKVLANEVVQTKPLDRDDASLEKERKRAWGNDERIEMERSQVRGGKPVVMDVNVRKSEKTLEETNQKLINQSPSDEERREVTADDKIHRTPSDEEQEEVTATDILNRARRVREVEKEAEMARKEREEVMVRKIQLRTAKERLERTRENYLVAKSAHEALKVKYQQPRKTILHFFGIRKLEQADGHENDLRRDVENARISYQAAIDEAMALGGETGSEGSRHETLLASDSPLSPPMDLEREREVDLGKRRFLAKAAGGVVAVGAGATVLGRRFMNEAVDDKGLGGERTEKKGA